MSPITATKIADQLNISRSYLYILREKGIFMLKTKNVKTDKIVPLYKTTKINNRRYLGNKYRLLSFIKEVVDNNCTGINTIADIFAGTGAVASAFLDKKIITNDIMYSNYICHVAWFSSENFSKNKIVDYINYFNNINIIENNYVTENFSDTYFSKNDCSKIGYIREKIELEYTNGNINIRERAILITSLLYAMDKIANTCGHYDAYRKKGVFDKHLELLIPLIEHNINPNNQCYNTDSNELVKNIQADLVYIDPPYNSRQYCDAYHVIENIARWEKPSVFGIAKKMDRTSLKSDYCTKKATHAFESLIEKINAKYIMLSYNNMSEKGNERSNAKIDDKDIYRILSKKGKVSVYSKTYKAFTTGKSKIQGNEERLFLCKCYDEKKLIPSPLNYTGGKFKLLPQILPLFPMITGTFVDLFCGGCNVGINTNYSKAIFNDINPVLIYLYNMFKNRNKDDILKYIYQVIEKYNLSLSSKNGYHHYSCDSSKGLGNYNKDRFVRLRMDFNNYKNHDDYYYIMLYILIVYSFNNQIRFNKDGKFNLPVGKRDFNDKMKEKLSNFIDRLQSGDYSFTCKDFNSIDINELNNNDFIYADPPYLITCATYNEKDGWNETKERELYNYLDKADEKGIRFALSNVLSSKGKTNAILKAWIDKNSSSYTVIHLNYNYSNSNYQTKDKSTGSDEVLIINY